MSKEQVRRDRDEFVQKWGEVVPLDVLLREFRWFQPRPKLRRLPDDPDKARELTFAAKVRLLKTLLAKVEAALLGGRLSAEPSTFAAINLVGEDGVLEAWTGVKSSDPLLAKLRLRMYQNHHLHIAGDEFLQFIGGVEGVRGDLGSAYGGVKPSAKQAAAASSFPSLVEAAVKRHLEGSGAKAVKEFLQEYEALKDSRKTGGRPKNPSA
jgi:hypothetical protein